MKSVFFHQAAKEELLISRDYYDELVFGLGKSFVIEVERCLNIIKSNPLAYPIVRQNIRKAVIMKFPFSILYKPVDENVYILAIMHQKRKPNYWSKRV